MAEIGWTEETLRWLHDIYDYIAQDSPNAAQNVVTEIDEKAQILKEFPEIGYIYRVDAGRTVRVLLYGH